MESFGGKKMDKIFGFGTSTVMLPYLGDLGDAARIMSEVCKRSRKTWLFYLNVFTDNLEPSNVLKTRLESRDFFENLSEADFQWLLSLPITYFKFNLKIQKGVGVSLSTYRNF